MVKRRRRFKQSVAFKDRLASFAKELRGEASRLPPSREKEELLERASQADTAARLDAWASSSKPQAAMLAESIWGMRSVPETPIPASRGAARAEALRSPCVMIVEDEYYLAADLELALRSEGAETVGPIGRVSDALRRVANGNFDAAVVDINLQNEHAYALADELKRGAFRSCLRPATRRRWCPITIFARDAV